MKSSILSGSQYKLEEWYTNDQTYGIKNSSGWSSSTYLNFKSGNFCKREKDSNRSSVRLLALLLKTLSLVSGSQTNIHNFTNIRSRTCPGVSRFTLLLPYTLMQFGALMTWWSRISGGMFFWQILPSTLRKLHSAAKNSFHPDLLFSNDGPHIYHV